MRFNLCNWLTVLCVLISFLFIATSTQAAQHFITGQQSMTIGLPGGLAALRDLNGNIYTADPYGIGESFSILVVLDTGASGCMLSQTDAGPDGLDIPLTEELYEDIGIGGTEWFYVSQPTGLMLAPIGLMATGEWNGEEFGGGDWSSGSDYDPSEDINNYSYYGDFKFQIRQADPMYGGYFPLNVNVMGTPVLNSYVMHVTPNFSGYTTMIPSIDYVNTELLDEMPSDLPSTGVYKISLLYENFIEGESPVTTSTNPTIENVKLTLGDHEHTSTWLFDTGGSVSIVGRDIATSLGIDLDDESLIVEYTPVMGVGGEDRYLLGYLIDRLTVPLTNGDELIFENVVIHVPEEGALPADLNGIFGMNLLNQSLSGSDIFTLRDSPFSDWYVDPFNSELIIVLGGNVIPEPGTFVLLSIGGAFLLIVRAARRRRR